MPTTMKFSIAAPAALILGVSLAACSRGTDTAAQDDFKRDLQMASSTGVALATPKVDPSLLTLENKPEGAPAPATTLKKAAGPRAVHSPTPTVEADATEEVAAVEEAQETEAVAEAPAPQPSEPVAVAPRPVPVVIQAGGNGDYGAGGGGVIFGGSGGSVIRGGGVDGDNCEIHTGRRGRPTRGPIFVPNPSYPSGGIGGIRTGGSAPTSMPSRGVYRPRG